ncbi:MAG TPA: CPBP family intramembrane glutamic endopeptidase [Thermodesulfobacteriota bacterium]|nr:CPBP family intramembrane glutamic endopeptidase [Thermodesulfobacteriota bacterium]
MTYRLNFGRYFASLTAYLVVMLIIALMAKFLSPDSVFPLAALLMFGVPFVMKSEVKGLRWNLRGVLIGVVLSVIILSLYLLLVLAVFDKTFRLDNVPYLVIIQHLLLVSVPEEVFFRGYLQEEMGNNLKAILMVSLLFAIGHLAVRCMGFGCSGAGYVENLLTFFPSLVMGYMYLISGTLWANIIFHFLANVVYIATGGL